MFLPCPPIFDLFTSYIQYPELLSSSSLMAVTHACDAVRSRLLHALCSLECSVPSNELLRGLSLYGQQKGLWAAAGLLAAQG